MEQLNYRTTLTTTTNHRPTNQSPRNAKEIKVKDNRQKIMVLVRMFAEW
jgi:hypothetical protein